jgi:hypothetical protein
VTGIFDTVWFWLVIYALLGLFWGVPAVYWALVAWKRILTRHEPY